jgi:glycogen debranching enzyme
VDGSKDLFIADTNNHTVRVGYLPTVPVIQTETQTVTTGSSVQFSVTASGRPTATYQWYFNGTAISGATSSTYAISNVQSGNAGTYTVVVSNTVGSVTSNAVTLIVNPAPQTSSQSGSSSSGGGGGGAPSEWFCGALALLAVARLVQGRRSLSKKNPPGGCPV